MALFKKKTPTTFDYLATLLYYFTNFYLSNSGYNFVGQPRFGEHIIRPFDVFIIIITLKSTSRKSLKDE